MRQQLFVVIISIVTLICPVISADQILYNHYSIYGGRCYDTCAKRNNEYYWCHTKEGWQGWNYCSPTENTDIYGNSCQKDHPCGMYGEDYFWCKTGGWGNWEKCGPVEPKSTIYTTINSGVCIDDCMYDQYYEYSWCHTENDWDYCSAKKDVTYENEPCKSDHHCDTYGYSYSWCYTETSWNKCGVIKPGECTFFDTQRRKRQNNNDNNNIPIGFCTRVIERNNRMIVFSEVRDSRTIADVSNNLISEIRGLISRWNNGYLAGNQARSVITTEHFRIDIQGLVNRDNQRYYNVQIQENRHRKKGQSTTVSQVFIPQYNLSVIPDRYVRRAFEESWNRRARVFLTVEKIEKKFKLIKIRD